MQQIYILLRNNTQLGPFTIEELLDQELLASDLIWIEGKSLAWAYASELNLLRLSRHNSESLHRPVHGPAHSSVHSVPPTRRKRYRHKKSELLPPAPPPEPRPRHAEPLLPSPMSSAFSEGDVEPKAEELRQRALAAERTTYHYHQPTPAPTHYTPDLTGNVESEIEFVYHKRGLKIPFPQILVGGMVIAMLVAGWYGQPLFRQKSDKVDATATKLQDVQENTAAASKKAGPAPTALIDSTTLQDTTQKIDSQSLALKTLAGEEQERSTAQLKLKAPPATAPESTATDHTEVVPQTDEAAKEPEPSTPIVVTAPKESGPDTVTEETKEKRKGFLRGLFKKKKNRDDLPGEGVTGTLSDSSEHKQQENQ